MNFWEHKRVLITGDKGFVGSQLALALKKRGALVYGMDMKCHGEEITVFNDVEKIIRDNNIKIVYHLAAEAIVGNAHNKPIKAFMSNICGTWNILEACRLNGKIEAIVVASSDKAYGEHKKLPYREDYLLRSNYPYDVSKSCADMLAQSYFKSFNLPVVVTRCGNIYGFGDPNSCRLVPSAIKCLLEKKTLNVRGGGKFIRDFIHIDDAVNAYIKIGELFKRKNLSGEIFNLGNDKPVSILDVVKIIGCKYRLTSCSFGEIKKQYLNSKKAKRVLGWKPKVELEEGLRRTINAAYSQGK